MKPRVAEACEHCENVGKQRKVDALQVGPTAAIPAVLGDKCFDSLVDGETEIWTWFRQKYPKEKT